MYLIFDTETTGLPKDYKLPYTDTNNWPRCIQIAWQLHDQWGRLIDHKAYLIQPDGFDIPFDAEKIHGICTELAQRDGKKLQEVLEEFNQILKRCDCIVGQNLNFDINIVGCEMVRLGLSTELHEKKVLDTCTETTANLLKLPGGRGGRFKLPKLTELHQYLFEVPFGEAHNATADVEATARCFFELVRRGNFTQKELQAPEGYLTQYNQSNPNPIQTYGLTHLNLKQLSEQIKEELGVSITTDIEGDFTDNLNRLKDVPFAHLHNHTQFSILQATTQINALVKKAAEMGLSGVAMSDSGNMMAAFNFVKAVWNHNKQVEEAGDKATHKKLKAIVGCELNVAKNRLDKTSKDNGYSIPFFAKTFKGYRNLAKICSQGWIDGFYYIPRVDKNLILSHKEGLIVSTGNVRGEIPQLILNVGEKQAEEALLWWKENFGDDFYIELNRHDTVEEAVVNETLIKFANKHQIKFFAANDNYYLDQKDAEAHDILICVKDGELKKTPIGRGRGFRYGLENQEYYFKSPEQMKELFKDLPEAIECTNEIVAKIDDFKLESDVLLPKFEIPEEFIDPQDEIDGKKRGENVFLKHLTFVGAKKRYGEITDAIKGRLDFELEVIAKTGYPGYFLIVQDFIAAARDMGVSVGPGRGSAAGSAVAYCIGITNVDPIKYDLLFERFLNPDRVSMPDIDIDFDDEGRGRVIQYVIDKYGASQVAQIITYGTMAAKSAIRDTARVLDLPLMEADRIAKLVPDTKLKKLFAWSEEEMKAQLNADQVKMAQELKSIAQQKNLPGDTVRQAHVLEGSMRNTGIHACGVIITPSDIREYIPVAVAKDSEMWCTQFDNAVVESAGLLKMDFLGLKTLTLIKDAIAIIKDRHGISLDADEFDLADEKTYKLFQKGETVGVFQYESMGMQKHMKDLKPTTFADLIAMNALYRPGPLEYIPSFIARKHGREPIEYDLDAMQEYLEETYGITVYQEQVMLLSQKLANFTKGEADMLRKAMGKKLKDLLEKLKPKFIEGGASNGHPKNKLEKIWKDWEAFASYAFNKSHSTCYAWVAYQTAYLKAHYPAEYMASVLSNNMNDIKQVSFFMEECRRMGVPVLGPDVNESVYKFTVNAKGEIRFGLGAVKGVGGGAVDSVVEERKKNGPYKDVFEFAKRVNLRAVNKRCFENLAKAGAFDCFDTVHRAQYFFKVNEKDFSAIEMALKYGAQAQVEANSAQQSLFDDFEESDLPKPNIPFCEPWTSIRELNEEKEMVGIYISGHPLDDFELELANFCNVNLELVASEQKELINKELTFAGIVTFAEDRTSAKGNQYGKFVLEDYSHSHEMVLFGDTYYRYKHLLVAGAFLYVRAKYEDQYKNGNVKFNVLNLQLLDELRQQQVKKIILKLDIADLDEYMVKEIMGIIQKNPGKCGLKCLVVDQQAGESLELKSDTTIDFNNGFIKSIKRLPGTDIVIAKD